MADKVKEVTTVVSKDLLKLRARFAKMESESASFAAMAAIG